MKHTDSTPTILLFLTIALLFCAVLVAQEPTPTPEPLPTPTPAPIVVPVTLSEPPAVEPDKKLVFPPLPRAIVEALRSVLLDLEVTPGVKLLNFDESASGLEYHQITRLLLVLDKRTGDYKLAIDVKAEADPTPEPSPSPTPEGTP